MTWSGHKKFRYNSTGTLVNTQNATLRIGTVPTTYSDVAADFDLVTSGSNLTLDTDHIQNDIVTSTTEHNDGNPNTNGTTPYTITASSTNSSPVQDPWKAYDNNTTPLWASTNTSPPHWWQIDFGSAVTIGQYRFFTFTASANNPASWTMLGSNTGDFTGEEVTLDTVSGASHGTSVWTSKYTMDNPGSYRYLRMNITAGEGSDQIGINELEFFENAYATTSNTALSDDLVSSGTISFDPSTFVVRDENGNSLGTGAVNIAYNKNGGGLGALEDIATFQARAASDLASCTSLIIGIQPVGANTVASIEIDNTTSYQEFTNDGGSDFVASSSSIFAVTSAGNGTFAGDLTVTGDFTVNGTTTEINTTTMNVEDNIITINEGEAGAGVTAGGGTAGWEIDRGSETNFAVTWTESSDIVSFGIDAAETIAMDFANDRLGVGTLTPSATLDIVGAGKVSGDFTVDTTTLHVDSTNNRVGVGTITPAEAVETTGAVLVTGTAVGTANGTIQLSGTTMQCRTDGAWKNMGGLSVSGTPVDNQVAVWTAADTLEGDANFTWDASTLAITGAMTVSGNLAVDTDTLFIDSAGDAVGINTATPGNYTLNVVSANDYADAWIDNTSGTGRGASFACAKSGVQKQVFGSSGKIAGDTTSHLIMFADDATDGEIRMATGGVGTVKFRLDKSGYMNVGTDTGALTEMAKIQGGLVLGTALATTDGTLQWTGSDFQGRKSGAWVSLTNTGDVVATGTPVDNQLAIWTDANTVEGDAGLTFDGTTLTTDGEITMSKADSGAAYTLTVSNTSNTASSDAELELTTAGTSAGDPFIGFTVTSGGTFAAGIDNTDSDIFKLTTGANPSAGTTGISVNSSGEIGMGRNPESTWGLAVSSPNGVEATTSGSSAASFQGKCDHATFTGNVINAFSARTASADFNFMVCQADYDGTPDNKIRCQGDGNSYTDGGTWQTSGADYAEYFESVDGAAIPKGTSVVFVDDKIRPAAEGEVPDGVISGNPSFVGGSYEMQWKGQYLLDEFGARQLDGNGNSILNPDFDPTIEYVPRSQRDEWHIVGVVGKMGVLNGQPVSPNWKLLKQISETVDLYWVR